MSSRELPAKPRVCNTYNMIIVKWHPKARQTRLRVITRALVDYNSQGRQCLASDWHWKTIRVDDRRLFPYRNVPQPRAIESQRFTVGSGVTSERKRTRQYEELRGNMPVVEVMPSLMPGQAYQAVVWIVGHNRWQEDIPMKVVWSVGRMFNRMAVCRKDSDPNFCASFDYWGPMLIQARIHFADGTSCAGYVYARIPQGYDDMT